MCFFKEKDAYTIFKKITINVVTPQWLKILWINKPISRRNKIVNWVAFNLGSVILIKIT